MDGLHGASIEHHPGGTDMNAATEDVAEHFRVEGRAPYIIPGGGSNEIGALGYVNASPELVNQANELGMRIDRLVHATGSAGTQAGLVAGLVGIRSRIPVLGTGVRHPREKQEAIVYDLAARTFRAIGADGAVRRDDVVANTDYVGDGYGIPAAGTLSAIRTLATLEGLLLDPVYSGKGMDGLIDLIGQSAFGADENIVSYCQFWCMSTAGQAALRSVMADFSSLVGSVCSTPSMN